MELRPIRTEEDHRWALVEIDRYFNAPDDSPEADYMDALATLVHAYENLHWPIQKSTPLDILKFSTEQNDRTQADLAKLIGSRSRASEIMTGKREMTLDQLRKISRAWRIPVALLVGELEDT